MNSKLFVGGFPYETSSEDLARVFGAYGTVKSVHILKDRETGQPRGLAFIEMASEPEARAAIAKLNGSSIGPRKIFVTEARPQSKDAGGGAASFPKPGFPERRSGRDRRQGSGPSSGGGERKEGFFERKKKWGDKPGFSGKENDGPRKKWGGKPGFGEKKKWNPAGPDRGDKWAGKPRKFGGKFGGKPGGPRGR